MQSSKFSPRASGDARRGEAGKVQSYIEKMARESERVKKYLDGKTIRKVVYVEGKIINFVVDK